MVALILSTILITIFSIPSLASIDWTMEEGGNWNQESNWTSSEPGVFPNQSWSSGEDAIIDLVSGPNLATISGYNVEFTGTSSLTIRDGSWLEIEDALLDFFSIPGQVLQVDVGAGIHVLGQGVLRNNRTVYSDGDVINDGTVENRIGWLQKGNFQNNDYVINDSVANWIMRENSIFTNSNIFSQTNESSFFQEGNSSFVNDEQLTIGTPLSTSLGYWSIANDATLTNNGTLDQFQAMVLVDNALVINNSNWNVEVESQIIDFENNAIFENHDNFSIFIANLLRQIDDSQFQNYGTADFSLGTWELKNQGTITNYTGASFENEANIHLYDQAQIVNNGFMENRELIEVNDNGQVINNLGGVFVNNGAITGTMVNNGFLTGIGSFETLVGSGVFSFGNSPGVVTAVDYIPSEGATHVVEIEGLEGCVQKGSCGSAPTANTDYDQILVSNILDLTALDLTLEIVWDFIPEVGDTFDIIAYNNVLGVNDIFNNVISQGVVIFIDYANQLDLPGGFDYTVRIEVLEVAIPEPSTYLLLGTLLSVCAILRKKKRAIRSF